jgi:hypothetical protein
MHISFTQIIIIYKKKGSFMACRSFQVLATNDRLDTVASRFFNGMHSGKGYLESAS